MSDRQKTLVVLGAGRIVREVHFPLLLAGRGISIAAVADKDPAARAALAARLPGCPVFDDWADALEVGSLAALVALPSDLHHPAAMQSLAAGKAVYLEKPPALTSAGAAQIANIASASRRPCVLGFHLRFDERIHHAKELVDAGCIGRVERFCATFTSPSAFHPAWKTGGPGAGALLDLATHHLDLLRFLFGDPLTVLDASVDNQPFKEASAKITLRLPRHGIADIFVSLDSRLEEQQFGIFGTEGRITLDRYRDLVPRFHPDSSRSPPVPYHRTPGQACRAASYLARKLRSPWHDPAYAWAWREFWHLVSTPPSAVESPAATADDGAACLKLIEEIRDRATPPMGKLHASTVGWESFHPHAEVVEQGPPNSKIRLSAILVSGGGLETVRRTLDRLLAQSRADSIQLLLAGPGGAFSDEARRILQTQNSLGTWTLFSGDTRRVARLQMACGAHADGDVVALCEDHSHMEDKWAESLIDAFDSSPDVIAAAPAMGNANPDGMISRVQFAYFFSRFSPGHHPPGRHDMPALPWHNTAYRRDLLLAALRKQSTLEVEGFFQQKLRTDNPRGRFVLCADVTNHHTNMSLWRPALRHAWIGGRIFASARAEQEDWSPARRLLQPLLVPAVVALTLWRNAPTLRREKHLQRVAGNFVAGIALAIVHAVGEAVGAISGDGMSAIAYSNLETRRARFVKPSERSLVLP